MGLDGPVTKATIESGAKMEATVKTAFEANGKITFVIKDDVASFETAQLIQSQINGYLEAMPGAGNSPAAQRLQNQPGGEASYARTQAFNGKYARAVDQKHVEVSSHTVQS